MSGQPDTTPEHPPTLSETLSTFGRIGVLSFGGPAAQIALMHRVLVEERRWITERQYLNALNFCMLLPGPEAMQLATYTGWRLHGTPGGLIAGLLFILPGAVVILTLAWLYALFGSTDVMNALFTGVKATVLVIVADALIRVARRALVGPAPWILAAGAFVALFALSLPYPLVVAAAATIGAALRMGSGPVGSEPASDARPGDKAPAWRRTAAVIVIWLGIWLFPLIGVALLAGHPILADIGAFFSRLAVVTFGGAYAVLAYMAQDVVAIHGWLSAQEMIDGLGLAETTPGPLILVTEFVGFIAAYHQGGALLGVAGAVVTLWATFAPCFLWIFAAAPYLEWIAAQPRLHGALSGITAAVVGVIANLSLWFALQVLFHETILLDIGPLGLMIPRAATIDPTVLALTALSAILLFGLRWGILRILGLSALTALALHMI